MRAIVTRVNGARGTVTGSGELLGICGRGVLVLLGVMLASPLKKYLLARDLPVHPCTLDVRRCLCRQHGRRNQGFTNHAVF